MSMRITTNGIFQGYRRDLANSYYKFSKSMSRVTTQRNFESYAEDVSAASRAFQLRRSHWRAENQITNSNYVISKFETAWSAIDYIVDGTGMEDNLNSIVESLRGLNSPTGSARVTLGESALEKAESIVRLLNTQYGDQFIFAGADGRNVPLAWQTDEEGNTWLTYRGIDVSTPVGLTEKELKDHVSVDYVPADNAATPPVEEHFVLSFDGALTSQGFTLEITVPVAKDDTDNTIVDDEGNPIPDGDELEKALGEAFEEYKKQFNDKYESYTHGEEGATAYENYEKLVKMSQETTYVDIGVGVDWEKTTEEGKIPDLIPTSAYNSALNALSFLGFGSEVGEDGELHSNNLVMLMHEMGTMLKSCDTVTGQYPEGWDTEKASALTRKIERAVNNVTVQHIKLSNDAKYLQTNLTQLTAQRDNLNNQILDIEQIDPADAITEYMYARYSYNAALSVGNSILTNTLLDYLR